MAIVIMVFMIWFSWFVIKTIINRATNVPTWKGVIISAMFGMLPFYLLMCWIGVWGNEREKIDY